MTSSTDHATPYFEGQTGPIAETAEIALQLLLCCREIPSKEVSRIADAQFVRFKLWASNIGVFAAGRASLDHRLRTSLTVRVTIEGNLENICGNLLSVLKGKSDLTDDELDDLYKLDRSRIRHFGQTLLQKSVANDEVRAKELLAVERTVGTLHRLSIAIRKASNRGALTKLAKLFDVDSGYQLLKERTEDTEVFEDPVERSQYEISSAFEGYVRDVLTHRVFSSTNDIVLDDSQQRYRQALFDRCVTTICTRRRQLVYFQRHQLKLSQRRASTLKLISQNRDGLPNHQFSQETNLFRNTPDTGVAAPPLSETVGSELRSASFSLAPPQSVASSTTSSNIEAAFGKGSPFEVPAPPKVEEGETEKACPYCCLVFPIKTFSSQGRSTAWKRHLLEDLQPYMCLFPNCSLQAKSYSSFKDWLSHLHQTHCHSWLCPLHTEKPHESSMETLSFDSLFKFETHLNTNHPDLDPLTIKEVTREAGQPAVLPKQCFICFKNLPTAPSLEKHMANHFKSMLLLALPWRDDVESEKGIASDRPANSTEYDEASSIGLGGDDVDDSDVDYATKEFNANLSRVEPMSVLDRVKMGNPNPTARSWNSSSDESNLKIGNDSDTLPQSDLATLASQALETQSSIPPSILEAIASDERELLRSTAAQALGKQSSFPQSDLATLTLSLKDPSSTVRSSTAKALGYQSSLPLLILDALASCLKDENFLVRLSAATALGNQSSLPPSILDTLASCLKDEDSSVRSSAAQALGNQSSLPPSILDTLVSCLKDEDLFVRSNAAQALQNQSSLPPLILDALTSCLKDEDSSVRSNAAWALGNQSSLPPSILDALASCLKDADSFVRSSAATALRNQSSLPLLILDALTSCLKDEDSVVRSATAQALGNQSSLPPSILDALASCLKDKDQLVRSSAAKSLEKQSALPPPRLVIAVIGDTGSGKSDFIQRVTRRLDVPVNHGIVPEPREITSYDFRLLSLDGRSSQIVELIDCPGFDDMYISDREIINSVLDFFKRTYEENKKLDAIIYMTPITRPRPSGFRLSYLSFFRKICGEDYYKKVVLATTHWDLEDEGVAVKRETELKTTPHFWGEMIEKGATVVRLRRFTPHHDRATDASPGTPSRAPLPEAREEDLSVLRLIASRCDPRGFQGQGEI